ncbi:MAG: hypothetical protein J1F09_09275, partial [Oscillospiraceae bacterium]|nr:hypothetical protein [Oscillospiraceae bacterium]
MDEYRTTKNYCPEATLYYLGDMDEYNNLTERDKEQRKATLYKCVREFVEWRKKRYPQIQFLDAAEHIEDGAPHIHERHVWIGHDEKGQETVCQEQALREMQVVPTGDPADPRIKDEKSKNKDGTHRYYNRKITYTDECREKLQEIARAHGIEIITEVREAGKKGQSQARYKTRKLQEQQQQLEKDMQLKEKVLQDQDKITRELREEAAELRKETATLRDQIDDLKQEHKDEEDYPKYSAEMKRRRKAAAAKREAERSETAEIIQVLQQPLDPPKQPDRQQSFDPPQPLDPLQLAREAHQNAPQSTIDEKPVPDLPKPKKRVKDDPHTVYGNLDKAAKPDGSVPVPPAFKDESDELTEETADLFRRLGIKY